MNDLTVLHLSDLHINRKDERLSKRMRDLINDIKIEIKYSNNIVIIITGDLVHQANYDYKIGALHFFKKLKENLGGKVIDIFIVPGNHDREKIPSSNFIVESCRKQRDIELNQKWEEQYWTPFEKTFDKFKELRNSIYDLFDAHTNESENILRTGTYGLKVCTFNGKKYSFVLLNSSWCCQGGEIDRRNLRVGEFQLENIQTQYDSQVNEDEEIDLTFTLAHHPTNWLMDKEEDLMLKFLNSSDKLDSDIYFCGHTHNRDIINWYNNRKSLSTLVSGLGWPDELQEQHTDSHTYSIYVFNLDINSVDIYVKSTDESGVFVPDFRIYTNQTDKDLKKIVFPIKLRQNEARLELDTGRNRSNKMCYINSDLMEYMKKFVMQLGEFRSQVAEEIAADCNDFWEAVVLKKNIPELEEDLFQLLFFVAGDEERKKLKTKLREVFENEDNNLVLYSNFDSLLIRICEAFANTFLKNHKLNDEEIIRFHFRYYDGKGNYKKLCAVYPKLTNKMDMIDHDLTELQWGDLIKASFEVQKPLIYSVNSEECNQHHLNEKWRNFITVVPIGDKYYKEYKNGREKRPLITFGVTSSSEEYDYFLYLLNYYRIDQILENILNNYMEIFPIEIEDYIGYTINQKRGEMCESTTK